MQRVVLGSWLAASAADRPIVVDHSSRCIFNIGLSRPRLSALQFRFLSAIVLRRGVVITNAEMVEHLWGDDLDGGPLCAVRCVWSLYEKLSAKGVSDRIGKVHGGYFLKAPRQASVRGFNAVAAHG